jgi:predicted amidohydrolase YtcJ
MSIKARIVQLGKGIFEYEAESGATVASGLAAAGISAERMEIRVRGRKAELSTPLQDGDLVTVIPLIKGGGAAAPSSYAETIITNATVRTMVGVSTAEAVAIAAGRIIGVGTNAEIEALRGPSTTIIDGTGATVLPSVIDSHTHFHRASIFRALFIDFDGIAPGAVSDVIDAVAARVRTVAPGSWIQGDNLREQRLVERRWPVRKELDTVAPDHPVVLRSLGKHLVIANSLALQLAGIDRTTEDPPGGRLERDADGEPTGVLHETAKFRLDSARSDSLVPPTAEADRLNALREGIVDLQRHGVSTIHEIVTRADEVADYMRLREADDLGVRVRYYVRAVEAQTSLAQLLALGMRSGFGDDWIKVGGIKISVDGACESRNAAMFEPYPGEPSNLGLVRVPQKELNELFAGADAGGLQIAVHAIGPKAADMALTAYETVLPDGKNDRLRHRLEHMYVQGPRSHFERARRLNLILSEQPGLISASGDAWREIFGEAGLERMMPLRMALDMGFSIQANSDFPSSPINPLVGVKAAVTRRSRTGLPIDLSQAVTVHEAMTMMTSVPAATTFEESQAGTIEVGKRADLRLLDTDPYRCAPDDIDRIAVQVTWLDGDVVYSDGARITAT